MTTRFGPWLPITVGLLATAVALLSLTTLQVDSPYVHLWPPFILIGMGIGLVVTAATDAIVGNTPVDEAGVAGGIQGNGHSAGRGARDRSVRFDPRRQGGHCPLRACCSPREFLPDVAHRLMHATAAVSQGLAPISTGDSGRLAEAITHGSHAAFMEGLHLTMLVAGVVALIGAAMGPFIRRGSDDAGPEHHML